ncbi:MAG: HAD family hydrolase [Actinomycetota bacterium]|nr:HAD family hydrolase [Actinomycetota bacterium]
MCLDVGEVLVDETRIWSTWADVLRVPRFTFLAVLGGVIARGGDHRDAFTLLGVADWREREPEVQRRYGGFTAGDLYPDALSTLAALRSAGWATAVVANQPASRSTELAALGVAPDVMAMSEALGVAKPDPAFYARLLELLGDPPAADVVYVGDRVDNDVTAAARAGLRTVWLRRGPWGLLGRDDDGRADATIDQLGELVGCLATLR